MSTKHAFAKALKTIRLSKGLTQEDFGEVSSRTYLSTLERGLKSPTLDKIEALSKMMDIHPLTLLTLTYLDDKGHHALKALHKIITSEIDSIDNV